MNPLELALQRKATAEFIEADRTDLVLIPSNRVEEFGTVSFVDLPPRPSQPFKVIWPGGDGIVVTSDGTTRRFDFILVGNYNATVAIGDHWSEGSQHYQVEWVQPYNEYEVKAGGSSHGSSPAHG